MLLIGKHDNMQEANANLVQPFQHVIASAMKRVREGEVRQGQQLVVLFHREQKRLYKVTDDSVIKIFRRVISYNDLSHGLFIEGFQLDELGNPIEQLTELQVPRSIGSVTQDNFHLQRGFHPEDVENLAKDLLQARKAPKNTFNRTRDSYIDRKRRGII